VSVDFFGLVAVLVALLIKLTIRKVKVLLRRDIIRTIMNEDL
jgi:hypothetical protein